MTQAGSPGQDHAQPPELHDFEPITAEFMRDMIEGLSRPQKQISSKYLYDEPGSHLFDKITELPEYYPTRTELAILKDNLPEITKLIGPHAVIIEPGSGTSLKTRLLLESLESPAAYVPIEISRDHLLHAAESLAAAYPHIEILPVCADFTGEYEIPQPAAEARARVVYFPGSTIGNFTPAARTSLLKRMRRLCNAEGGLLIGIDRQKDPAIIEPAYNDAAGVTAAFNLNLLERANRELDTDFDLQAFKHHAPYNTTLNRIEMHLVSQKEQDIHLGTRTFHIGRGETIFTESSHKFTIEGFADEAAAIGLRLEQAWSDEDDLFGVLFLSPA